MEKQLNHYIQNHLSPYWCGYQKGHSTQQTFLALIESWKKRLHNKGFRGAILMDLSRTFDTLNHELLIAKLHAYGFDKFLLKLFHSYLSNIWHKTQIKNKFSSWAELLRKRTPGISFWSSPFQYLLKWLIFSLNILMLVTLLMIQLSMLVTKNWTLWLTKSLLVIEWFENSNIKLHQGKCHLIVSGHKYQNVFASVGQSIFWEIENQKLSGIIIERILNFNDYVASICKNAGKKLSVLARLSENTFEKVFKITILYLGLDVI